MQKSFARCNSETKRKRDLCEVLKRIVVEELKYMNKEGFEKALGVEKYSKLLTFLYIYLKGEITNDCSKK